MPKIESLTHLGLGRADTGELLPRTLPGEEVEIGADGLPRILVPSADRVSPPCRHFKSCGGCAMQHAADGFVATWKQSIVERALSAHGISARISGVETSPANSRRRAKLAGRRTKKGALVGFHAKGSDTLIEIPDCRLLSPGIMATLPALQDLTARVASRKGELGLTVTESLGGPDIHIDTDLPLTEALRIDLAAFANQHSIARLVWRDEQIVMINPPHQKFGAARVVPPPGAFLQATKAGEASLLAAVLDIVGKSDRVIDLFAGCGTFSLPLATTAEVHAVEGEKEMLVALDRGWREAVGLKRVTTEARDLFRRPLEPDEFKGWDAVVIDPPRAGAEAQVATLARSGIKTIAMVSCNPVTFARDAKTLVENGYDLNWTRVVDQFRWSPHVECVASFTLS